MLILLVVFTGIMAGIYFAFSVVIIKSLNQLATLHAAQTMNKINDVIVNTWFLPVFFATTLWYAGLIVWAMTEWQSGRSGWLILAAMLYILGMFGVTVFGNVPLNNRLKESAADDTRLVQYWAVYQDKWTRLNHVRTLSCMASCTALVVSLI